MVVSHTSFGTLVLIKTDVEALRKHIHAFQRATSPRRQKPITTVEPSPGQEGHTRANFESCASIHAAFALASGIDVRAILPNFMRAVFLKSTKYPAVIEGMNELQVRPHSPPCERVLQNI